MSDQKKESSSPNIGNDIWFKARPYGWGWYPSTWQGWAVIAAFIASLVYLLKDTDEVEQSMSEADFLMWLLPRFLIPVCIVIFISWVKGEKPSWQWGGKPMKKPMKIIFIGFIVFAAASAVVVVLSGLYLN